MKTEDIRNKEEKELRDILKTKREKLQEMSQQLSSGRVKNIKSLRKTKKDIARILTILNEGTHEK